MFQYLRFDCKVGHQGITPGCMDIYKAGLDCQWIDVTGIPYGEYILQVKKHLLFLISKISAILKNLKTNFTCLEKNNSLYKTI